MAEALGLILSREHSAQLSHCELPPIFLRRPRHISPLSASAMFASVAPVTSDDEDEAATKQQEEDEIQLQIEFGADDNDADEQQLPPDAEMEEQTTAASSPPSSKKRQRDTRSIVTPTALAPTMPPLPASALPLPSRSSSSSVAASSSRAPRIPSRPSRPTLSATAASDRAAMDESLSSMLQPSLGKARKRGRPVGSTADRLPAELQRRMGEANSLFVQQEFEACEQLLKSIIHQSQLSLAPYHTLALVYESQADTRRLCDTLQIIAELAPRDVENWKAMARVAQQLNDVALADKAVGRAVQLSGGQLDEGLAWVKGWVEVDKRDWKRAAATWSWLLEKERHKAGDTAVREALVRSLRGLGDSGRAIAVIEEYVQLQQDKADRAAGVGHQTDEDERNRAREQKRTEDRQRREQRQRDTLYSDDAAFDSDTDSAFFDSDSEAEDRASVAQSPLNLELVTALCWLYNEQHLYTKVDALMESIALLLPAGTSLNLELRCLHAVSLLLLGHTQRATIQLNRLLDVNFTEHPDFLPLLLLTANAYRQSLLPQSALSAYRLLVPHAPYEDDPAVWVQMAACLRGVGTTEEEWSEAKELYERVLEVDEGNTEARIGLAALERERGEEKEEEEEKEEKADRAAPVREHKEKRPRRRATPAEPGVERPLPTLPEEDIDITHLLQTTSQLSALEEKAVDYYQRKDYASLIADILPTLQRTAQVASGNNPQPPPPTALSSHHPMPSLEDEHGQPASSPCALFAPLPAQLARKHRVAASRLLLSRAAFQTAVYVVKALSSPSAPSVASAASVSATTQSANLYIAVQLVSDLSTHFQLKRTYSSFDAECPRLLFGPLYEQCIPLLLALDQTQQAYSYCQHIFDKQNIPAALSAASSTTAATDVAVDKDLNVVEVVGAVLRRMGYPKKVRRWLTIAREKSSGHDVAVRVLLAHSWYSHRGYNTAAGLYHQALAMMRAMPQQRQQAADWQRLQATLYLYLSLALLHRALSVSSRMKLLQRQQQSAQLLRSLAYLTAYHNNATVHTAAKRTWNVGRWHQAARYDAQAARWYERVLGMAEEAASGEDEGGGVGGVRLNVKRRAAECLALVYKRSGNEMLAARLYAEYGP